MSDNASDVTYKDKFIAFIDILGFKEKVKASEKGSGLPLKELLKLLEDLGSFNGEYIPHDCPQSERKQSDLDFCLTQISDCVIISCEVSPAGIINLIHECSASVERLMMKGIMCRGYISRGSIYHTKNQVIGSGYQDTYLKEGLVSAFKQSDDDKGTPFVEIDSTVCNYVSECGDRLVQKRFFRFVKSDGVVTALYPFSSLSPTFTLCSWNSQNSTWEKENLSTKDMILKIKKMIESLRNFVDASDSNAVRKLEHYITALDQQIEGCYKLDRAIEGINSL